MIKHFRRLWPLFFISALFLFPKITFAADWVNIGFADKNIKTVYVDAKNNQHILVSLASYLNNSYDYYTEDGGTTWAPMNMGGVMTQCNNFAINPKNTNDD